MTEDARINPLALTPFEVATLLSKAASRALTVAQIEEDVAAGVPVNDDGTINLVAYCAWLSKERGRGD